MLKQMLYEKWMYPMLEEIDRYRDSLDENMIKDFATEIIAELKEIAEPYVKAYNKESLELAEKYRDCF